MKRIFFICAIFLFTVVATGFTAPKQNLTRMEVNLGTCFYGDAMGISVDFGFVQSMERWLQLFAKDARFDEPNLLIGAKIGVDLVPVRFYLYSISFELQGGYRLPFSELGIGLPLSLYTYLSLGTPINIYGSTSGTGAVNGGFFSRIGAKVGYELIDNLELGALVEYKMNVSGIYIGSINTGLFVHLGL